MRWVLLLAAGCFAPSAPEGAICGADLACPTGQACFFERCQIEAPPCVGIEAGPGMLTIPRVESEIVIDGQLADWPTCFVSVDTSTAGLLRQLSAGAQFAPGRFSIAASPDGERIFVAAEVTQVLPLGDHALPEVYLNNAVSTYIDADGVMLTNHYDTDATQIVVDHANRTAGFRIPVGTVEMPALVSATSLGASTFTVELSVTAATFGRDAFAETIGFTLGLVGGNGDVMTSELVWFQACKRPECGCASSSQDAPYCDARQFGRATIAPPL